MSTTAMNTTAMIRVHDFAHVLPLALEGASSAYRMELPEAVYRGVARGDLADVRVFDANEQPMPVALVPLARATASPRDREALPTSALEAASGFIADATKLDQPVRALVLDGLAIGTTASVRVDASDDRERWRVVVERAGVARRGGADIAFAHDRIEVPATNAAYWRIVPLDHRAPFALRTIVAEVGADAGAATRRWLRTSARSVAGGEHLFDLGGQFAIDRLRVELPAAGTALVAIASRARSADPWQPVAREAAYRLTREGGALENPALALAPTTHRHWRVRVERIDGAALAAPLVLHAGWVPRTIAFVAQGAAPYALAFGNHHAEPATIALEALLPGYRPGAPLRLARARLETEADRARAEAEADAATRAIQARGGVASVPVTSPVRGATLWAGLGAALVAIVGATLVVWKRRERR